MEAVFHYPNEEKAQAVAWFIENKSFAETQRLFGAKFRGGHSGAGHHIPDHHRIQNWLQNFLTSGSVELEPHRHEKTAQSEENVEKVLAHMEGDPHSSIRNLARAVQLSRTTVHRVLHEHHFHPYKMQMVQALYEDDLAERVAFAEVIRVDVSESLRGRYRMKLQ